MITLLVIILVVGVIVWYVNRYVPMEPAFKTGFMLIALLAVLLYALSMFGLLSLPAR